MAELFLIRKGGYYYRPNARGYTASVHEAGRFPKEEAFAHMDACAPGEIVIFPAPTISVSIAVEDDIRVTAEKIVLEHVASGSLNMDNFAGAIAGALEEERAKANTPPPVQHVDALEAQVAFTLSDASRLLRKQDVEGACPNPDDCFYFGDRVRCGPCAVKASAAKGIVVDDTHSHLPEVCRLRREVRAATARIAELEAAPPPEKHVAGQFDGTIDSDSPLQAAAREAGWALTTLVDISDWQRRDQISAIIARLASALLDADCSPPSSHVAVKPLEWGDNVAHSPVGHYRVQRLDDKWEPLHNGQYMLPRVHGVVQAFDTLEAAKAAAQADYERRIRAALATTEGSTDGK